MAAPITPSKGCSPITPPKQSSPITPPKGSVPQTPPKAGSDTESDWGTWRSKPASGKATMVQTSVPAKGGKAAPCVPRVSVRPVFSHPPLPKEKQAKLEQSRASFAQRVSESRAKAAGPKKRSADTPYTPDLGTVSEQQQEFEEHEQRMRSHYGVLATLRVAARERRQGLLLSARDHVASAVAASGLPETANLTESDCSDTTEWWRNRVRGATSIEEINRLQVNFRKLKQLEEESAVIVSSGSEEEWEQDSAARVEYFRGKVLRMFDEASRVATSSGVGSEEHGESSSPTVDVLVNPTSEYVGYWSPATTSEPTPGAEMAPQTPSPPGVIAPGAEFIPETPPPSGMMASGATGSLAAKAVLEKAAAKALLESLVREQERQDREQERQQLEGPPKGPPKFPPRFLAPTPKVRSIASKTSDPKPSRKASVPKPSKKAGTPEPVPAATSAPEPEPVQPKRRLPPPRAVASTGATAKPASTLLSPPPPPAPIYPTPRVEPMLVHPMQPRMPMPVVMHPGVPQHVVMQPGVPQPVMVQPGAPQPVMMQPGMLHQGMMPPPMGTMMPMYPTMQGFSQGPPQGGPYPCYRPHL